MNQQSLHWIYTYASIVGLMSIVTIAQIVLIGWMFKYICEELNIPKVYKGFAKFRKWALALLFMSSIISIGATAAIITYWKAHGL